MCFLIWFYTPILRFTFTLPNRRSSPFSQLHTRCGVQKIAFIIEHVCVSMNFRLTIYTVEKEFDLIFLYISSLANPSERCLILPAQGMKTINFILSGNLILLTCNDIKICFLKVYLILYLFCYYGKSKFFQYYVNQF